MAATLRILLCSFAVFAASCLAQIPPPARTASANSALSAPPGQSLAGNNDRFAPLRENADRLKTAYDKLDTDNMAEVDQLLRTRRCQINRVGGLLDRTIEGMRAWSDAEIQYWKLWGEVEQQRVDGQQKSLASMEADQKHAEDLVVTAEKDREELTRQKGVLEKYGKRTEDIRKQMDALVQDIQESEARLSEARKTYDDVTIKVRNMQASISARLIDIRQNLSRVEAFALQLTSYYEQQRAVAQEICNTKQPDTNKTVLPNKARPGQVAK
jgi:chromosome segregation ATPase